MRTAKCPKCRSKPIRFIELWKDHSIVFVATPDGTPEEEGVLREGSPYCVEAECGCGHRWRLRGVLQIDDLTTE